jgi:hypothetical protein
MLSSRSSNIKVKHQTPSAEMRLARMTRRYRSANGAHERGVDYTGKQKAIKIPANRRAILFESLCFFFSPFLFFSSLFSFRARARARELRNPRERERARDRTDKNGPRSGLRPNPEPTRVRKRFWCRRRGKRN